jgi:hypothetical protein
MTERVAEIVRAMEPRFAQPLSSFLPFLLALFIVELMSVQIWRHRPRVESAYSTSLRNCDVPNHFLDGQSIARCHKS